MTYRLLPLVRRTLVLLLTLLVLVPPAVVVAQEKRPEWVGKAPEAALLGPDKLWRTRESLVFHLYDDQGDGFDLDVAVRDMNTYCQGPRAALVWLTGPDGKTLLRKVLEDDGIRSGNFKHKDGITDTYLDFRYREWHRTYTEGGYPKGKERSPLLDKPQTLRPRHVRTRVPAAGKGLYRLVLLGSWDHWFSVTPSRPLGGGIHPGSSTLYLHADQLAESYFFVPRGTRDVGISISEEIEPFNWTATVRDPAGKVVDKTEPKTFLNYIVMDNLEGERVYRLDLGGKTTGAHLHFKGLPLVLCPTPEVARKIRGGYVYRSGDRWLAHGHQKVIADWAAGLKDNDFQGRDGQLRKAFVENNVPALLSQGTFFWFRSDGPTEITFREGTIMGVPMRSPWYPMHVRKISNIKNGDALKRALPAEVWDALCQALDSWCISRSIMDQGECSNQWAAALRDLDHIMKLTGSSVAEEILRYQNERFCMPANLGRTVPDLDPYALKGKVGYGVAADSGIISGGTPADGMGHDAEYCLESTLHMARNWTTTKQDVIVKWLESYYDLKTHLSMPKYGKHTTRAYQDITCPTDSNFRTSYTTHKSPLGKIHDLIRYGDLWKGTANPKEPWPCLSKEPFVHNIDNRYVFVKTPGYYSILYGGNANHSFSGFTSGKAEDGSAKLTGYRGMHYTGLQRKPTKLGGISAVFVENCGPTLLSRNHNVMFSNNVWGRRQTPICKTWEEGHVDPKLVAEGYAHPDFEFDEKTRVARRTASLEYAPLTVTRTMQMKDDRIVVDVDIVAEQDVQLEELYECLPLMVDRRVATIHNADFSKAEKFDLPKPLTGHRWKGVPEVELRGENLNLNRPTLRAISIESEDGAGSTIILDKPYRVMQTQPIRHRRVAAAVGGINLPLPHRMKAGERHHLRWIIVNYQKRPTSDALKAIAGEEAPAPR